MKKIINISIIVISILIISLVAIKVVNFNYSNSLDNYQYLYISSLMNRLNLSKKYVQKIPNNYMIMGKPYGIYYKANKMGYINELWIYSVPLSYIPPEISAFKMLETLKIRDTGLTNINNLEGLSRLKMLDLSNNNIKNMKNINNLPKLETVDLSNNNIETLGKVYGVYSLEYIDLSNNYIENIENLHMFFYYWNIFNNGEIRLNRRQNKLFRNNNKLKKINIENNLVQCNLYNISEIQKLNSLKYVDLISDCN